MLKFDGFYRRLQKQKNDRVTEKGCSLVTALVRRTSSAVMKDCDFAVGDGSLSAYVSEDQALEVHVRLIHVHRQFNCALR